MTGVSASRREHPQSTNVSSPVQAAAQRRRGRNIVQEDGLHRHLEYQRDDFVVSDNDPAFEESDEEDSSFEARPHGKSKLAKKRQLGPPITTDEKMEGLNETHRMVVEDFVVNAKKECDKVISQEAAT